MWFNVLGLLAVLCIGVHAADDNDEPVLYYYGLVSTIKIHYTYNTLVCTYSHMAGMFKSYCD